MKLDRFISFLDEHEILHRVNDESIILNEAPCCGGGQKIYLYKEELADKPFFGKCMKCDTSWNSWTYLNEIGIDRTLNDVLHGQSELGKVELGVSTVMGFDLLRPGGREKEVKEPPKVADITGFYRITELPDHEATKYAIKRGWHSAFADDILIDIYSNSVIFVARKDGVPIGYQGRFLKPRNPKMKTKTMTGFKKTQHVIEFPNSGDILICEGPFTALAAWHYGYHAICTMGSGVSTTQIQLVAEIAKRTGKRVGVAFDMDAAGKKGLRAVRLGMYHHKVPTFRVRPEHGNDLNDSWQAGKGVIVIEADQDDITIPDLNFEETDFT